VFCYRWLIRLFETYVSHMFFAICSIDLPVWPTYTLPHSHGILYTPGTFRPKSSFRLHGPRRERSNWNLIKYRKYQQRRRFYVKPGLVSCVEYAIQSESWAKQGEFVTPRTSPHWLARSHEHGAWAGIYMTRLGASTTSEPWGQGQRRTSKRWSLHV
jgi:hypothetical protein